MILLFYIFIIVCLIFFKIISNYIKKEDQRKLDKQKKEEDRKIKEIKNAELLKQLSQYSEFQNNFKKLFNVNVPIGDYKNWIYNDNGNPGETFLGYMLRTNNIALFGGDLEKIKNKCKTLNNEELFSITPKGKGVNINEMKIYYFNAYWEDRKKEIYWD